MLGMLSWFAVASLLAWLALRIWYSGLVRRARAAVRDADGGVVPGPAPRLLVGNLLDVYRAKNHLSAYHAFHQKFGSFVQIFWMWRSLLSVADYGMARQVLVSKQNNYLKFLRRLFYLRRLFGLSILTKTGSEWMRDRRLLNASFSSKSIVRFHDVFVSCSEQLAEKWNAELELRGKFAQRDVYPDLSALFLDIVGKATLNHDFGALRGERDAFLESLNYILEQSLRPMHAFVRSWHRLPLRANRKVERAQQVIDDCLATLIRQRREATPQGTPDQQDILDLLLQAPLSEREVRDNLVAFVVNGHETVATSTALTLLLLARHPDTLTRAQAEVDRVIDGAHGRLTEAAVTRLHYLDCVVYESLRLYPPIAGLNRISMADDVLAGWSVPRGREVGIALMPLHLDGRYFGEHTEQFRPERYLELNLDTAAPAAQTSPRKCPLRTAHQPTTEGLGRTQAGICLPLSFGDGKRRCLGEHFARYEMKVTLAVLLRQFDFRITPGFTPEVEIKRHGLAVSLYPKHGVRLDISRRASSCSSHSPQAAERARSGQRKLATATADFE